MTTFEDKMNQRRKEANHLHSLSDLVGNRIYELESLIPASFWNSPDFRRFERTWEDVLAVHRAFENLQNEVLNNWIDEDVRDHWPPDDFHLPDGTGS
jgi:hypothetical protein